VKEAAATTIDDCDAYCRNSYSSPYNQATCVRVLESIGIDCSRGTNFLQEEDAASPEIAMSEIEKSQAAATTNTQFRIVDPESMSMS
jgi:hypothetical protein